MSDITIYREFISFDAERRMPLKIIDFEDLPWSVSSCPQPGIEQSTISNPLVIRGVRFTDPYCLGTGYYAPLSDNCLFLNVGGTIDLPTRTAGVLLNITGIGDLIFEVKATDSDGNNISVEGQGITNDYMFLGFTSPNGMSQIEVIRTGDGIFGPLCISELFFFRGSLRRRKNK